jgi:zinc/manganese transport system substrate-binding protein
VRIVLITALSLLALSGCGNGTDADGKPLVVATTPQLADFARQAGGDRVEVRTLLPANVDPHDFEPRPSDARAIAEADYVLRSGGEVDAWLDDLFESAGGDEDRLLDVGEEIGAGGDDPHWWQDPRMAAKAVDAVAAALAGEATEPGRAYAGRIRALDRRIAACMRSIPRERRKLVTNHDAFGWFARRYDIEVLGSIIPGRSTSARPSARDVRELVAAIRREGVRTIFPESALDQRLEEAVAGGGRAGGGEGGPPVHPGATYVEALRHDAAAMARGFGGDCRL